MLSKAGRIHAKTIDEAVEQIPDDVIVPKIWPVYPTESGWWFEYRGWVKER